MASECFHHENGPQKQALLIAPSYDLLPDLKLEGTGNDLKIMKTILEGKSFQFHSIKEVTGQSATRENILRSMAEVTRLAVEGSVLVVYYSGHGYSWKGGPDSADQDEGLFPALTPQDMKSGDIDKQCVSGYDLKDYLLELSKKKVSVTFIFDCCFSGHMYRGPELDDSDFKCTKARQVTRESLLKLDGEITASQDRGNLIPRGETNETPPKRQWKRINEGWLPQEKDKFFHLAACSSIEHAWEGVYRRNIKCGLFTKILSDILERCSDTSTRAQLTYKGLFSLIQRGFMMGNYSYQTPQIEGGNLDTVLFGHSVVPQSSKLVDIGDVTTEDNTTVVQLQAGYLQLLQAGEYDVFKPTVNDSHIFHDNNSDNEFWLGAIEVDEKDIEMVTATGRIIEQRKGSEIQPGCKASLRRATQNARTSVLVISSIDEDRMKEKLMETQEFRVCCMEPQSIIWEQELWPGDKFHIFGPRDGHWCPEIYFDTPELRHTVLKMSLTVTWRDQGWGNRKGELFLKLMRPIPIGEPSEVAEFRRLFGIAEHHQTTRAVVIDNHPVVTKAREGDFYRFMRNAGGGGGHQLTVKNFHARATVLKVQSR